MGTAEMVCEIDDEFRPAGEKVLDGSEQPRAALKVAIARLSDQHVQQMRPLQLVDLVKSSGVFSSREWFQQLQFMEHDDLKRLAYLARRSCRREINTAYEHRGWRVPFLDVL